MNNNLKQIIDNAANIDIESEERFKQVIVTKLIEALGYDLSNKDEVCIECPVYESKDSQKADYVIKNSENKFVLEIKSPTEEIEGNQKYYDQIDLYYMLLRCKYGILYNGKKLLVFKASDKNDGRSPVYIWNYEKDYPDITIFESLSKGNFPQSLEDFLSLAEKLSNLEKYIKNKNDKLLDYIISKISEDSKIDNIDFVRDHTDIKIEYKSNIAKNSIIKVEYENNNIEDIKDFHFLRAGENIKELYIKLKNMISGLDPNIETGYTKVYTKFTRGSSIFASVECMKNEIKIWLRLKIDQLEDPKNLARDVHNIGHHGVGDSEITLKNQDDLYYVMDLIKQSYNKNK